jgi:hypothetical protein
MTAFATRLALAAVIAAGSAWAQSGSDPDLLRSIDQVLGRGDRAPTIDEILGDTLGRLRGIDAISARAAAGRLRETESELRLYETLLKQVRSGLLVEIPMIRVPATAPSAAEVALETKRVQQLARQLHDAESEAKPVAESRPRRPAEDLRASTLSDALLDVLVEVPKAPEKSARHAALDPANLSRALFQAGDFAGTLEALDQIPAEKLTPEQRFRRARALDQLGRLAEARAAYEAVVASERDGAFGRQAAWMLKLARTREQVAGAIGNAESRATEKKK